MEVAASLAKRDGIPTTKSFLLWLLHTLESEADTREFPRVFISMEQLMDDWQAAMQRVSQILQIDWSVDYDEVREDVENFLDPGLKHHNLSLSQLEGNPKVPVPVTEIYHSLVYAALDQQSLNVESFSKVWEGLRREIAQFIATALLEHFDAHLRVRLDLENRLRETRIDLWENQSNLARVQAQIHSMLNSRSWKITAPLRKAYDLVERLRSK